MGQQIQSIGQGQRMVVPGSQGQEPPPSGVYQPPPPGTLGGLANRMKAQQPPPPPADGSMDIDGLLQILLARQFPQLMGHAPEAQSQDLQGAETQPDDLTQLLMQRGMK